MSVFAKCLSLRQLEETTGVEYQTVRCRPLGAPGLVHLKTRENGTVRTRRSVWLRVYGTPSHGGRP
jgi:hypothetical protein